MRRSELVRFLRSGNSTTEMAFITKKSQTTIRYWLNKYGLKSTCLPGRRTRDKNGRLTADRPKYLCRFCGETNKNKMIKKGDGRKHYTVCKKCHSDYTMERFRDNKRKAIEYKGGQCIRCGYNKCDAALDFHHRDSLQKDINFIMIKKRKFEDMIKELDKCDMLCSNCHREEHYRVKGL